ncbi:D-Ala-D-Ala carboxypeptidase 3 family protein [Mycobacterium kansasii 732]|nr:D-Ala-D-Ala carboxypeptidase 3 family protein [Mycobacterium kansasii 732]
MFIGVAVLAFVAAVVAAAAFFTTGSHGAGARPPVPPPRPPTVKPGVTPVADTAPAPSAAGVAAALAQAAADPNLGRLAGRVTDALTGQELWRQLDDLPLIPASTNKVLTATAALLTLDRQARVSTRVVAGTRDSQGRWCWWVPGIRRCRPRHRVSTPGTAGPRASVTSSNRSAAAA